MIIETHAEGGRLLIDFFSPEDLSNLIAALAAKMTGGDASKSESNPMPMHPNTTQLEPEEDERLYSVSDFSI